VSNHLVSFFTLVAKNSEEIFVQIFCKLLYLSIFCKITKFISRGLNRSRPAGAIRGFFVALAKAKNLERNFLEALKLLFWKGAREPLHKYFLHKQDGKT